MANDRTSSESSAASRAFCDFARDNLRATWVLVDGTEVTDLEIEAYREGLALAIQRTESRLRDLDARPVGNHVVTNMPSKQPENALALITLRVSKPEADRPAGYRTNARPEARLPTVAKKTPWWRLAWAWCRGLRWKLSAARDGRDGVH